MKELSNTELMALGARIASLKIEAAGMEALNQYRLQRGETIAYDDEQFQRVADDLNYIYKSIMERAKV